jgi:septal ring factor EnvC (AmiA/AmiB activator)
VNSPSGSGPAIGGSIPRPEFSTVRRGFDPEAVLAYVAQSHSELSRLAGDNWDMRRELAAARTQLAAAEKQLAAAEKQLAAAENQLAAAEKQVAALGAQLAAAGQQPARGPERLPAPDEATGPAEAPPASGAPAIRE